jgi:hypothetical protein
VGSGLAGVRETMMAVGRAVGDGPGVADSLPELCADVGVGAGLVAAGAAVAGTGVGADSDLSHGKQAASTVAASKVAASALK